MDMRAFLSLTVGVGLTLGGCSSAAPDPGKDESAVRSACVFGATFTGASGEVGSTKASPLSAITPTTRLSDVQERRLIETARGVAPETSSVAQAFEVAHGRFDRTSLEDAAGRRSFTAYTFQAGSAVQGAVFEVGLADVVARIDRGAIRQCTASAGTCIFPGSYSEDEMVAHGFQQTDHRLIDEDTAIDSEDSVEASQTARAVIETIKLLGGGSFETAKAAVAEFGAVSAKRFTRSGAEYLVVEEEGEVYGAIFEVERMGPLTLRARFADTEVTQCTAFDAGSARAEGESCVHHAASPTCNAPDMACASGLVCDTNGADHVCARGRCRRP